LKAQIAEVKKIKEDVNNQLKVKEVDCEKHESEIVFLRKELEKASSKLHKNPLFEKNIEEGECSKARQTPRKKIDLHANALEDKEKIETKINVKDEKHNQRRRNFRRNAPVRQSYMYRYNYSFNGHCYACNQFGHKAIVCKRNTDIIYYKCNNVGHLQRNCKRYDSAWKFNMSAQRYY